MTDELVDAYLALGRTDEAVAAAAKASQHGHSEAGELLCDLAGKLMRYAWTATSPQICAAHGNARPPSPDG